MTHILREPTINGHDLREIIRFDLEEKVSFFQGSGPRGKAPGGAEEQAEQAWMDSDKGYRSALLSTLKRTRKLPAQGSL